MTFLNSLLAFGTLAFTIPLVIHLLNRSQYRTVDWGAMIFLDQQQHANSRKIEWKHLLLLLLRCAIPIFLALAMARPFLSGSSWLGTSEPIATVIILDDSLSMQAKGENGESRWSTAVQHARTILKSLPEGGDQYLILGGVNPVPIESSAIDDKLKDWATNPSVAGPLDFVQSTRAAFDWLNRQLLAKRQVIYISDFQSTDWPNDSDSINSLKQLANQQAVPPVLSWIDVSSSSSLESDGGDTDFQNYSIGEVNLVPKWFSEGQSVTASCTVYNHSSDPVNSLALSWQLDGSRIESQKINIAARSSTRLALRFRAPQRDWHVLEVKLDTRDGLDFDNRKQIPFLVQERNQVLLIDGDLQTEPMQSESDFLRVALSPFTFSQSNDSDFFDTKVSTVDRLAGISDADTKAIVLCNVPRLDKNVTSSLRDFAATGGGVIIFFGDRVDADSSR